MSKTTAHPAPRQRKPRPKPLRFVKLVNNAETITCTLVIRSVEQPSGKETVDSYVLENIGSDSPGCCGFSLTKSDGTVYNVELDGGFHSCDCQGHTNHGHCKHASSLAALIASHKLNAA